jgi:hypothetical protein
MRRGDATCNAEAKSKTALSDPLPTSEPEAAEKSSSVAEWDDTKLRHAYLRDNRRIALCGYDGPSTWKNEAIAPPNVCPICLALLPQYWDAITRTWL